MNNSKKNDTTSEVILEELTRRLLVMVRDSGEKRETDIKTDIAQKIKETEVPNEDK